MPEKDIQYLLKESARADYECTIDLQEQRIRDDKGFEQSFEIDSYWKEMLINGWDEIDVTLKYADKITDFEKNHTA